ncbi:uncharacterized protein LOC110110005 isoform X3 [Dendrobium catenatum]|uniref:uncharacterized protein LOC110110005 isoform X3 n=1 Tax=Dendrobium catenatum TaxID=906689 RepID=UPI0009F744DE|nr:uncharacterized protein LOC110110005 isoform X3 [Dendrobium catenatum]
MSKAEGRVRMLGFLSKCKVGVLVVIFLLVGFTALYELLKPVPNGCIMTYMYPTYIPISTPANESSDKYGLFLYHEGWKKIDFIEHIKKLDGTPVLFIPGNGGSYKQVRSLAAESSRAYEGGPLEENFYQEASFLNVDISNSFKYPTKYKRMLDWFAVDLEGEHSAMDGRILKEHTEYVVYSIHRILDLYKDSRETRSQEGADASGSLPNSVILVGHSMGGFVARAAAIHPGLRKSAIETILTLSSPHQAPPVALQPSLGHYFSQVNHEWKKGFIPQAGHSGHTLYGSKLSHVLVVSVSGGFYDYQVRSKLASLDGIVPSTNGFMISSSSMKNVWRSMEHQTILWCNQLVIQLSHTLLTLINPENGQPFTSLEKRLLVFTRMLQGGLPQSLGLIKLGESSSASQNLPIDRVKDTSHTSAAGLQIDGFSFCPPSFHWRGDVLEKDLSIHSTSVTVLAMDGRRRWLDIRNQSSNGKDHFIFVTNLAPCSGVRLHLWPEKRRSLTGDKLSSEKGVLEVTSKMAYIPTGPAPRQIEPGSQTEQAPPSSILILTPEEMQEYQFLTISVAPRLTVSGRPPPAVSMAVGQFFNPKDGEREFSPSLLLRTTYSEEEMLLKEDHNLALNFSFSVSLGILPVTVSLQTEGCGLKDSADHVDQSSLCRLRCFPTVGLAWDSVSGLHVIPNINSETIIVDSSPAMWDSGQGSDRTIVFLLVDPHCSYKISVGVSLAAAASRFCLLYSSQIMGFMVTGVLFGLMRQAHAWELDLSFPSILEAVELNLRMPRSFLLLAVLPIFASLVMSLYTGHDLPVVSYVSISMVCYLIANGSLFILIFSSQLMFYMVAILHVFIKRSWLAWQENVCASFLYQIIDFSSILWSLKVVQILRSNPSLVAGFLSISLVCFVHPALGLIVLVFYHSLHCHASLCSFLAASFRSNARRREFNDPNSLSSSFLSQPKSNDALDSLLPIDDSYTSSPNSVKGFGESQLEIFNYKHGLLILHLIATLMFIPSLVAWLQRIGMGSSFPWFIDSVVCIGIILHGLSGSRPDTYFLSIPLPFIRRTEISLSLVFLLSGYYSFLCALAASPYMALYAMAAIGAISLAFRIIDRYREVGSSHQRTNRKHSHRH